MCSLSKEQPILSKETIQNALFSESCTFFVFDILSSIKHPTAQDWHPYAVVVFSPFFTMFHKRLSYIKILKEWVNLPLNILHNNSCLCSVNQNQTAFISFHYFESGYVEKQRGKNIVWNTGKKNSRKKHGSYWQLQYNWNNVENHVKQHTLNQSIFHY